MDNTHISLIAISYDNENCEKLLATFPVIFESKEDTLALKLIVAIDSKVVNYPVSAFYKINEYMQLINLTVEDGFFVWEHNKSQALFKMNYSLRGLTDQNIKDLPKSMISNAIFYYKTFGYGFLKLSESLDHDVNLLFNHCLKKT